MLRVARVTAVLATASIVACFTKPGAPHTGDGGGGDDGATDDGRKVDGQMIDGRMVDANLSNCGTHDDYNMQDPPCGLWGTPGNPNYMQRNLGVLEIRPQIPGGSASCTTTAPFKFANGASIEIPTPLATSMGDHSWFKVSPASAPAEYAQVNIIQLGGSGVQVQVTCSGPNAGVMTPYTLSHRFWRLSPQNNGDAVKIESGQTAGALSDFTTTPTCDWLATNVTMVNVTFGATAGMSPNNTGTFDNFNTNPCPPQ